MESIIEKYLLLVEKISNSTKMFRSFNTDVNIYRSEIHIIQLIGDRMEVHISEISRLVGVTKATWITTCACMEAWKPFCAP